MTALYRQHSTTRTPLSPVLIVALDDLSDAGEARGSAAQRLRQQTDTELVASFDTDELLDYRAHPPLLTATGAYNANLRWPEIQLDLGADPYGQDWLLLHGPAPAHRWQAFGADLAVLADRLEVRMVATLSSATAPVPHTRPSRVLVAGTCPEILGQLDPDSTIPLTLTANIDTAIARAFNSTSGIPAAALSAQVPTYLSQAPYPAASAALLDALSTISGLGIDTAQLHTAAEHTRQRIDEHVEGNESNAERIRALERHFDNTIGNQCMEIPPTQATSDLNEALFQMIRQSKSDCG